MNLKAIFNQQINLHFSYFSRLKIRRFATGIAFGALLGTFAFGSMGMHSQSNNIPTQAHRFQSYDLNNVQQDQLFLKLSNFRNSRDSKSQVKSEDLKKYTEILLANLASVKDAERNSKWTPTNATDHLRKARISGTVNRGQVAMLLFNITSDFLNLNYRDFAESSPSFSDIPRFHFLSAPTSALHSLGIELSRNSNEFGSTDPVSIEELFQAGVALGEASRLRLRQKLFTCLPPQL
jgi:hypothetical protein